MTGAERNRLAGLCGGATGLLRSYRDTRDPAARERLIELYLPLVTALARRYANRGERLEDLVQVGAIGLIEAIDRFDPTKGSDFVSFAVPTITGEIRNHLRDRTNVVRIPRRAGELNVRLRAESSVLAARLCRAPTTNELAREAGIGESDVLEAMKTDRVRTPVPLPTGNGPAVPDAAILVDGVFDSSDDRLLLAAGFRALDARQQRIVLLRFFAGLSQAEIAREVGISQIQVSRLIRASLDRMRRALARDRAHVSNGNPVVEP
jgi:RNA polymerase sigma-B factor